MIFPSLRSWKKSCSLLWTTSGHIFGKNNHRFREEPGDAISNESMYGFLRALQEAFIIHKVPRYDIKENVLLETQEKYYIWRTWASGMP